MLSTPSQSPKASRTPYEGEMPTYPWTAMEADDLIKYRDEITEALRSKVAMKLDTVNLEEELLLQMHISRGMQTEFKDDDDIPLSQRVALVNSVNSVIERLIKLQAEVYDSERFKAIENALIRAMDLVPEDVAAKFLVEYEQIVNSVR